MIAGAVQLMAVSSLVAFAQPPYSAPVM
jgi:hypothetical protein